MILGQPICSVYEFFSIDFQSLSIIKPFLSELRRAFNKDVLTVKNDVLRGPPFLSKSDTLPLPPGTFSGTFDL